ncbi:MULTISPECIES: MerR family DNA-binding transcriptional regulator [Xanthobacter]|uniref:DNA-binding transcriptional MerR regulator n=1 Tax=Xanthobacter flavus TaxID=281 RepID=A0ABU1KC62_XANFL|nr:MULTISPECIES: MerR family DNA-binding transcriptional regulator [Xanthobacter]MDR6332427.1 DNA-binding transcriptional MerR regulator [Xanthobacter flavus]NMN56643.1 DNA-binding transcriptional MerR regulator [Xanthobacter sp. SG618]UDQ89095.1 MerR family DNA-binding transcriptional regulator [Xanthobacter autotrophicus]
MTDTFFTVTQLARDLSVTPRTIRFYEDKGLITPRRAGTMRVYTKRDRARMALILRGKRLGFSLREIKDYLDLYDLDPSQSEQIRLLLKKVQDRLEMLEDQRLALEETIIELKDIEEQALSALASSETGDQKAAG